MWTSWVLNPTTTIDKWVYTHRTTDPSWLSPSTSRCCSVSNESPALFCLLKQMSLLMSGCCKAFDLCCVRSKITSICLPTKRLWNRQQIEPIESCKQWKWTMWPWEGHCSEEVKPHKQCTSLHFRGFKQISFPRSRIFKTNLKQFTSAVFTLIERNRNWYMLPQWQNLVQNVREISWNRAVKWTRPPILHLSLAHTRRM